MKNDKKIGQKIGHDKKIGHFKKITNFLGILEKPHFWSLSKKKHQKNCFGETLGKI